MYIKSNVFPQANIYSSKTLFDSLENRNQKRIAQIIKRKNALHYKIKGLNIITKDKSSEQMITPSTQEISTIGNNKILDLSKSEIKEGNNFCEILSYSKPKTLERFLSSFKIEKKNTDSLIISNNLNMNNEEIVEKEVNISSLNDNENYLDTININGKEKNKGKNKKIILNNKIYNNNLTRINDNLVQNQNDIKNISQRNRYALEFLSSNLDSFVEFKNKLVTKAKYNKNYFTSSYSQALFLEGNINNKKFGKEKNYNYEVNDIIKEENESFSPKANNNFHLGESTSISFSKNKNKKNTINYNNRFPNKSFFKKIENYIWNSKNIIKAYSFNKNYLINNDNLKISKDKLSMEIKNKRKTYENKEYNLNNKIKNKKDNKTISSKFLKLKLYLKQINQKDNNNIYTNKEKSKKVKKKIKINIKKDIQ